MKFSDLLPSSRKKVVGRVVTADWDPAERGVRFALRFEPSGRTLGGILHSGMDSVTGNFLTEADLKQKLPQIRALEILAAPGGKDPNQMSSEEFRDLKIEFSLSDLTFSYRPYTRPIDGNTFLSRILR